MRPTLDAAHRAALLTSPLGAGLRPDELEPVLDRLRVTDHPADAVILAEGQAPTGLHVVLEGVVEVRLQRRTDGVTATLPLAQIGVGGVFGEYSSWDPRPVSANVVALTPTRLAVMPVRDFLALIDEHDHLGKVILGNLLRTLIHRLRMKVARIDPITLVELG